jgi:hypothetical protein
MSPRSGNRQGRIACAVHTETKYGFVQKSREINLLGEFRLELSVFAPDFR